MYEAEIVFLERACAPESRVIVAVAEAKSEKAIFHGNSSTPKQKYLFSVSVINILLKTEKHTATKESN